MTIGLINRLNDPEMCVDAIDDAIIKIVHLNAVTKTLRGILVDNLCTCPYLLPSRIEAVNESDHDEECPYRVAIKHREVF